MRVGLALADPYPSAVMSAEPRARIGPPSPARSEAWGHESVVEAASESRPKRQRGTECLKRKEDVMKTKTGVQAGFAPFMDPTG